MITDKITNKTVLKIPEYRPNGLKNAVDLFEAEASKFQDAKFMVYWDPDIDGLFAGYIVEEFLKLLGLYNKNFKYKLNEKRKHGFFIKDSELASLKGYTIIAVDFSITKADFDRILKAGVNLINIDHHEIDVSNYTKLDRDYVFSKCGDAKGIILNNQYDAEPKEFKFLSGAGMVYYFLKAVAERFELELPKDFEALVGITLLSDIRVIESDEARAFLLKTFTSTSDYIKYLHWLVLSEKNSNAKRFNPFGMPNGLNRDLIDYSFSPLINALLRADKGMLAVELIRQNPQCISYLKDNDTIFLYREIQKKIVAAIAEKVKENENIPGSLTRKLSTMVICCLESSFEPIEGYDITNYIGVACSKIKDEDKVGVIFVIDEETGLSKRGSFRGSLDGVNYLDIFKRNGVPAAGHQNAFGILECKVSDIDFEKIDEEIRLAEEEHRKSHTETRTVIKVPDLGAFFRDPHSNMIALCNAMSRDSHRIFIKYTGPIEKIKPDLNINSTKFARYKIDDVTVTSFDVSLDVINSYMLIMYDNQEYKKITLRPSFVIKEDVSETSELNRKLGSLL